MHPLGGPQYEWKHILPPSTPKATPPTDKAGPFTDIIETAAAGASCADASLRHQLNAVPPVRVHMPRPPAPGPGPDISSQIPSHSLRGRGPERRPTRGRVASGQERLPCTMHNPTAPTAFDSRTNALASPAGPGPARRPPRSRSKPGRRADERGEPLSCSSPQHHRHARTPASDVDDRNRPRCWSCGCRPLRQGAWPLLCQCAGCPTPPDTHCAGSGGRSAASRLAVRRRLAGRPACVTVQGRHAGPKPGESAFPARQSIQKGHRKRSERLSQAFRHP